ncbi:MAG: hypothetical protein ACE5MG_08575 [Candidatus Methylomirabilales bacterium]
MRTFIGILIGLLFFGLLGLGEAEAVNIRVREVRRDRQASGLSIVYELRNASVDPWDLRRVELHVFDRDDRRLDLLRPTAALRRLQREDIEFVRALIPPMTLLEAQRLEIRIFVEEVKRFPVADPVPRRLVYSFPLRAKTTPAVLQTTAAALRLEPAGTVLSSGSHRAILLRLINQGRETLSDLILSGEISTLDGQRRRFQILVEPKYLPPGAEAYVAVPVPKPIVNRVSGLSMQAFYRKAEDAKPVRYVEALAIHGKGPRPKPGRSPKLLQGSGQSMGAI